MPERIRLSYEANMDKELDDMELKDFDTKWFIGVNMIYLYFKILVLKIN